MRDLVERLLGGRVERWVYFDEEGCVFGHPSVIEVDLVVRDGEHVLVKVKLSASRADVYELASIVRLYERVKRVKPKLAIISPYVEPRASRISRELDVAVYTGAALEE